MEISYIFSFSEGIVMKTDNS